MAGKCSDPTWYGVCFHVICAGMERAHAGSGGSKLYDHNGNCGADRCVWVYEDGRKHFPEEPAKV